ncbi:Gfo/Idh/MocA family oxidoreductase, partial [bacterium]|nr:Gfo/Idh/MocA family oxidoreductase [bacterium]
MRRRDFVKMAGAGLLVLPRWARGAAPSDQIVMGIIGTGGMGGSHTNWFLSHKDVRIDALCDVDDQHAAAKLNLVHKKYGNTKATACRDFRKVLDRKDIDAISTATPDHWHALIACHGFLANKDVYAEKPLAHNYREAKAMLTLAERNKRVYQLGTQIHAGDNYHRVVELVRSGKLGKIGKVHVWKTGGTGVIAKTPDQKPPKNLDWDRWLGPAPMVPYNPHRCHFKFRYYQDYSFGMYADFWCHISDIVFWALELGAPTSVVARGELQKAGVAHTPKWIDVDVEFPGLEYRWTTKRPKGAPGKVGGGIGAWFVGDKGSLVTEYGKRAVYLDGKEMQDIPDVPKTVPRSPGHQRNFLDCVKSRKLTESNLPYAVKMTTPMFFGRISLLTGRPLKWDAAKEEFAGDPEAT